jgi:hypothetical protein
VIEMRAPGPTSRTAPEVLAEIQRLYRQLPHMPRDAQAVLMAQIHTLAGAYQALSTGRRVTGTDPR